MKEGRACLGLEFFVNEGDSMWTKPDEELVEQAKRRARAPRPGRRVEGGGRLRGADAEGLPGLRRALRAQRRRHAALDRGELPERLSGRAQRHAPLQQPGPLDVHGDALGREHLRGRTRRLVRQRRRGVPRGSGGEVPERRAAPVATRRSSRARPSTRPRRVAASRVSRDPSPGLHADLHRGCQHRGAAPPRAGRAARRRHPRAG